MTPQTFTEQLDEVVEKAKATPGPWKHGYDDGSGRWKGDTAEDELYCISASGGDDGNYSVLHTRLVSSRACEDADYIAAAHPALLLELARRFKLACEALDVIATGPFINSKCRLPEYLGQNEVEIADAALTAIRKPMGDV